MPCGHHKRSVRPSRGRTVVALVGTPNVGKSAIFYKLTGKYAWISNYPGTTVDIEIGVLKLDHRELEVVDTPGMYSLYALTEDEKVARRILFEMTPELVIHVVDAKNIDKQLGNTLLLIDAGFNVILDINAVDEARKEGIEIDTEVLSRRLGIPVVATVAIAGKGIDELKSKIAEALAKPRVERRHRIKLGRFLEKLIKEMESSLRSDYPVSRRLIALLAALGDDEIGKLIAEKEQDSHKITEFLSREVRGPRVSLRYMLELSLRQEIEKMLDGVIRVSEPGKTSYAQKLSDLMTEPVTGLLFLLLVLASFYVFVGYLGAQILVDFLESEVFDNMVNPVVNAILRRYSPHPWVYELIGGEYGIITLGIKYAIAIILPIVALFFIAFSIVEDSGYLPRLAILVDKALRKIGLNGKAIIPLVLGTGCDTMATIVTRTLETRKEKMIATLMLALGVPCSAQLGVILGLLPNFGSLAIWGAVVIGVLLTVSFLASKILPGDPPFFIMELPPLRLPKLENVLMKTWTRLEWYFKEVIPLFVLASVLIWIGRITGVFDAVVSVLAIPTTWIGLPPEGAVAFLYGFFRRDYGAAGFYDLRYSGLMNERQTLVSMVTITLFVPCIAQFLVMSKERGWKYALAVLLMILPLAFSIGFAVNRLALLLGW